MSPGPGPKPKIEPSLLPLPETSARRCAALMALPGALVHPMYPLLKLVRWHQDWMLDAPKSPGVKSTAYGSGLTALVSVERRRLAERVRLRRAAWVAPLVRADRARRLVLTAKSDAVVWLVSAGPLELGLAVHHVYGFPFLPGTSLKGLARAHSGEADAIYGTPDRVAQIAILDGLPLEGWDVRRDVMTPHFPSWYGEKPGRLPDDADNPIPIPFLSIAAGSRFEVVLLARDQSSLKATDQVESDLRRGLDEAGLGAKTAAGYGVFDVEVVAFPADAAQDSRATAPREPARVPSRSPAASALDPILATLRAHTVKPSLSTIEAHLRAARPEEQADLLAKIGQRLQGLGFRKKEAHEIMARLRAQITPPVE